MLREWSAKTDRRASYESCQGPSAYRTAGATAWHAAAAAAGEDTSTALATSHAAESAAESAAAGQGATTKRPLAQ